MDSACQCGLLTASKTPVPLKNISVDVQVKGFVADVSATLKYKNEEQNPLEAVFVFPIDEDSAVYNFEAMVDGKTIIAEIQEKKQAQETYEDAISQGQEAFLLEQDTSSGDIFSCSVGNLPPGQEASVTLSFVRELALEADGAVRFVLPAVLNPRYTPQEAGTESVTTGLPRAPVGKLLYTLKMNTTVQSSYGVSRIESNCGLSPLQYLAEDKTAAQVSLTEGHQFDRDVELLIYYNEVNKPSVTVEAGLPNAPPGSLMAEVAVMLNFYPNIPESGEQSSCGEFIFIVDRSGSMDCGMSNEMNSPQRIDSAKETLLLLLKSLPLGCFFNIFGFGSHFESFFPESVEYTQESMDSAMEKVKSMSADFGGTEILEPLKHIYNQAGKPGHPRQLFVFTDGEVGNTAEVISLVQRNNSQHRCFAFGIGEGASTALIKGITRAANGTCEFITGKERMQPKSDDTTDAEVSLSYTFKDEIFNNTLQFPLQTKNDSRLTIHRLAAKNVLRDIDQRDESASEEVKKKILETSLQSGVVSSLTAFIAVNKDLQQPIQGPLTQRNIPVPYIQSMMPRFCMPGFPVAMCCSAMAPMPKMAYDTCHMECSIAPEVIATPEPEIVPPPKEDPLLRLISLQKADGSWQLDAALASALGTTQEDLAAKTPGKNVDPALWATVLAVIWLHSTSADQQEEWELLEAKALSWVKSKADSSLADLVKAGNSLLQAVVNLKVFGL